MIIAGGGLVDSVEKRGGVGYQGQLMDVEGVLCKEGEIRLEMKYGRRG
jgi:hypothetical protein